MADYRAKVVLGEALAPVGQLRFTRDGPRQYSSFAYDAGWIEDSRRFALSPDMPLDSGPYHHSSQKGETRDALGGAFADAAPDNWGRRLLERSYDNGLSEFEYLTLSDDTMPPGGITLPRRCRCGDHWRRPRRSAPPHRSCRDYSDRACL